MAKEKSQAFFKLPFSHNGGKAVQPKKDLPRLKIIFFIVDWNKSNIITKLCEEKHFRFSWISKGKGTASSEVLDLLGIGASDKAVIFCIEHEDEVPVLLKEVRTKLGFHSPGAGIAFTIPLSGINTPLLGVYMDRTSKNEESDVEGEEKNMPNEKKNAGPSTEINHDLIIAIINLGCSDDFMNVAREAGATGGTVISARELAHDGAVRFFGVTIQEEREIVFILTNREKKLPIMEAISLSHGITSNAEGIIFSLPVDSVMGLSFE